MYTGRLRLNTNRLFHTASVSCRIQPGFFTSVICNKEKPLQTVLSSYPLRTSKETHDYHIPPVGSKMLVREFIDDSLYNPNYGFYSKSTMAVDEFEEMEQEEDHIQYLRRVVRSRGRVHHHNIQQLRYTLTELFKVKIIDTVNLK